MSGPEIETIPMDDIRAGYAAETIAEADVVVAVDMATGEEDVVFGELDKSEQPALQAVVRVELDVTDDADELKELIDRAREGTLDDETVEDVLPDDAED